MYGEIVVVSELRIALAPLDKQQQSKELILRLQSSFFTRWTLMLMPINAQLEAWWVAAALLVGTTYLQASGDSIIDLDRQVANNQPAAGSVARVTAATTFAGAI